MKTPFYYCIVLIGLLAFPGLSNAGVIDPTLYTEPQQEKPEAQKQDRKKEESKPKPEEKRPEVERPEIKEVPKSRRLPKPKAVVDRVIRRPPVRVVRPGGLKPH